MDSLRARVFRTLSAKHRTVDQSVSSTKSVLEIWPVKANVASILVPAPAELIHTATSSSTIPSVFVIQVSPEILSKNVRRSSRYPSRPNNQFLHVVRHLAVRTLSVTKETELVRVRACPNTSEIPIPAANQNVSPMSIAIEVWLA